MLWAGGSTSAAARLSSSTRAACGMAGASPSTRAGIRWMPVPLLSPNAPVSAIWYDKGPWVWLLQRPYDQQAPENQRQAPPRAGGDYPAAASRQYANRGIRALWIRAAPDAD